MPISIFAYSRSLWLIADLPYIPRPQAIEPFDGLLFSMWVLFDVAYMTTIFSASRLPLLDAFAIALSIASFTSFDALIGYLPFFPPSSCLEPMCLLCLLYSIA